MELYYSLVLGYVLAGIFAGPYFRLLPTVSNKDDLTLWADIGIIFLLFGLGLEFSFMKMLNVGKAAMITANAKLLTSQSKEFASSSSLGPWTISWTLAGRGGPPVLGRQAHH